MGKKIKQINTDRQEIMIDVSALPAGIYNIQLYFDNGERVNNKVVVVH